MDVSAPIWKTLSELLDEALDLEPAARSAWLDRQAMMRPELGGPLRGLLAAHATSGTADVLAKLPEIDSAAGAEPAPNVGLAAGEQVGPYRLERLLGSGGMADVWLAERSDGAFARRVALKLPRINVLRRDLALRFARERDILARLENPHIARFYDAGLAEGDLPYLAMEFVDGRPINEECDARRLDVGARLRLFAQVVDAVQYAHANLVIHRDLKPTNILVTADGQVRLLDFGIAKLLVGDGGAAETQLTQVGSRMLTPDYASPEQVKGEPLTISSDVYSLGVVLYELLSGQRPYRLKLKSIAQVEQAIVLTEPAKPSASIGGEAAAYSRSTTPRKLARRLAGDLDTIVLKALAKSPADRYATTAELAEDLRRHVAGEPVRARPASWRYRAGKFIARNALASAAAAVVSLALLAAASVSLWQARQAREQAQLAGEQTQLARAQAARAEEVKKFVLSVLRASDADRAGGRQTTAIDLLKQARERLDAAPIADGATRAELLATIGNGLLGLGEMRSAAKVLSEAAQLGSGAWGEIDRMTADARIAYGFALFNLGDWRLATEQFDAAERTLRVLGDLALLARVLRGKSALASDEGDYDLAVKAQ
ncbi:MAG TPA: serine/threonine-protein kinase [Sphingomicrobium sp.]